MSGAYPEKVWRLFRQPRRAGQLTPAPGTTIGTARTPAGAAVLELQLLRGADGRIEDAAFRALGCPYLIATGAWLCAYLIGRRGDTGAELDPTLIIEQLTLPAVKRYCAVMACEALAAAWAATPHHSSLPATETVDRTENA